MRSRDALVAAAVVLVAAVAWVLARGGPGTMLASDRRRRLQAAVPPRTGPSAPSPGVVEPRRNVFRFGDETRPEEAPAPGPASRRRAVEPEPTSAPEPGPRLVGLVRRGGRLVAAFAAPDGEVELAGPGEAAGGVLVVAIGDDAVRVRRPDGSEATLPLP